MSYHQSDGAPVTLRTQKFIANCLLQWRQMVVDVLCPLGPNISKTEQTEQLATLHKSSKCHNPLVSCHCRRMVSKTPPNKDMKCAVDTRWQTHPHRLYHHHSGN